MLSQIRIRDLVLIDELDLVLSPGFNVLTGETGTGKSLVATAVALLLGAPAGPEIVRLGAEFAEVEGIFDVTDEPGVRARLVEAGLPSDDELLVRRVVPGDGRQRCYVNGRLSSRGLLAELAADLASFAGQHEHLALLGPARQLELLDAFAGLDREVGRMSRLHADLVEAERAREQLLLRERDRVERLEYLAFQVREIDDLAPEPGELDRLAREVERLKNIETLLSVTRRAAEEIYERDGSIFERLGSLGAELSGAARHDETLGLQADRLAEAAAILEEAARDLSRYASASDEDPGSLDERLERQDALRGLTRKHGRDLDEILGLREELAAEMRDLEEYDAAVAKAGKARDEARAEAHRQAAKLSAARESASTRLARAVVGELRGLAMDGAEFTIGLSPRDGEPGPTGSDRVEFLVRLNPGEGAHPLRKVASGGELSRLMLALRRSVAGLGPHGSYIFDEVDAGVGGAEAAAVGRKLAEVAEHHQVVCITHLPQIASFAESHFVVGKKSEDGRTVTHVRRLEEKDRVDEIARMLGGEKITERSRAAARELLAAR